MLGDLSGPKIRVGKVVEGGVDLRVGQLVAFQKEPIEAQPVASGPVTFSTTYANLCDEVTPGETILLDDGSVRLTCQEKREDRLICRVEEGGIIKAQRLNVGFSRAKECMHFILSKPLSEYNGSIGEALRHYENIFQSDKPIGMIKAVRAIVHENAEVDEAYKIYEKEK